METWGYAFNLEGVRVSNKYRSNRLKQLVMIQNARRLSVTSSTSSLPAFHRGLIIYKLVSKCLDTEHDWPMHSKPESNTAEKEMS